MRHEEVSRLIGKWATDPRDLKSLKFYGRVTLEFRIDGTLIYTIHQDRKNQNMLLKYRVENGILITDQPSAPREERTPFFLTEENRLVLKYGRHESVYVRIEQSGS